MNNHGHYELSVSTIVLTLFPFPFTARYFSRLLCRGQCSKPTTAWVVAARTWRFLPPALTPASGEPVTLALSGTPVGTTVGVQCGLWSKGAFTHGTQRHGRGCRRSRGWCRGRVRHVWILSPTHPPAVPAPISAVRLQPELQNSNLCTFILTPLLAHTRECTKLTIISCIHDSATH